MTLKHIVYGLVFGASLAAPVYAQQPSYQAQAAETQERYNAAAKLKSVF